MSSNYKLMVLLHFVLHQEAWDHRIGLAGSHDYRDSGPVIKERCFPSGKGMGSPLHCVMPSELTQLRKSDVRDTLGALPICPVALPYHLVQPVSFANTGMSFTACLFWPLKSALLSTVPGSSGGLKTWSRKPLIPSTLGQCMLYAGSLTPSTWLSSSYFSLIEHPSLAIFLSLSHFSALLLMSLGITKYIAWNLWGFFEGGPQLRYVSCHDYYAYWSVFVLGTDYDGNCQRKAKNLCGNFFRHFRIVSHWEIRWGEAGSPFLHGKGSEKKTKVTILHCSASASRTFSPLVLLNLSDLAI